MRSRKLVITYINTTTYNYGLHSSSQPMLSTDPEIPNPGIPACVFHLAAFYDTGWAGKRFRTRFIIYLDDRLETNDGHEKYSFQIDGLLNLLRSKQSGSEKYQGFFLQTEVMEIKVHVH